MASYHFTCIFDNCFYDDEFFLRKINYEKELLNLCSFNRRINMSMHEIIFEMKRNQFATAYLPLKIARQ